MDMPYTRLAKAHDALEGFLTNSTVTDVLSEEVYDEQSALRKDLERAVLDIGRTYDPKLRPDRDVLVELLATYRNTLAPWPASELEEDPDTAQMPALAMAHAAWMCTRVLDFYDAGDIERCMRWLGFIQGVLWMTRLVTRQELLGMTFPVWEASPLSQAVRYRQRDPEAGSA